MLSQSIKDIPRNGYPLFTTAKRYWLPELEVHASDPEALTLILLHGTSFHKETWEPSLEYLLKLSIQPGSFVKIREAWALDCPNHGEAGHLNEPMLNLPEYRNNYTCEKYAKAVHRFLSAGPEHGARIDFRKRNLVGIGHSLGGNAMLILQHLEPRIPFTSLIIIEPMLSPAGPQHLQKLRSILVKGAHERRDVWPDSEQAMKALTKRERTNKWDPRITQLFVDPGIFLGPIQSAYERPIFSLRSDPRKVFYEVQKFAIVPHPGSYIEETPYTGVTLACTRDQEAAMYRDADGPTKPVLDLNKACASKPVHIILGGVNDFIPRRVHEAILDSKSGRNYASKNTIQGVGHLVPQEAPEKLGAAMFEALASNVGQPFKSKL